METVWDYNVTKEEQDELTFPREEEYQRLSLESANFGLYLLFSYRGQKDKAKTYFNKLSDNMKRPLIMQDEFEFKF
ncbi:MAG: hypothetical protein AB7U05_17240 [Mangrovibacterium sp.]